MKQGETKQAEAAPEESEELSDAREADSGEPKGEMWIEYMNIDEVQFAPRNPKKHDEKRLDASFGRFGFVAPPQLNEGTGKLVAGHGRIEGLLKRRLAGLNPPSRIKVRPEDGAWLAPIIRGVTFASDADAELYLLADNRLSEKGGYHKEILADVLSAYDAEDADLVGFDEDDLADLSEELDDDEPPGADDVPDDKYDEQYGVIIVCKDAEEQERVYNQVTELGLKAKVVAT